MHFAVANLLANIFLVIFDINCLPWGKHVHFGLLSSEGKKGDWDRDVPGSSGGRQS